VIQIGSFGGFWGWLVEENLAKLCVHFEPCPAVWTYYFCSFAPLLIHPEVYDIRRSGPSQFSYQSSAISFQRTFGRRCLLEAGGFHVAQTFASALGPADLKVSATSVRPG
jgi:hypothetical protein